MAGSHLTKKMADKNPLLSYSLIVLTIVLIWLGWQNEMSRQAREGQQQELIDARVAELKLAYERMEKVDEFIAQLSTMSQADKENDAYFKQALAEQSSFGKHSLSELDEKLDLLIQNQQLRNFVNPQIAPPNQ